MSLYNLTNFNNPNITLNCKQIQTIQPIVNLSGIVNVPFNQWDVSVSHVYNGNILSCYSPSYKSNGFSVVLPSWNILVQDNPVLANVGGVISFYLVETRYDSNPQPFAVAIGDVSYGMYIFAEYSYKVSVIRLSNADSNQSFRLTIG